MTTAKDALLEIQNLTVLFPKTSHPALKNVSFTIAPGEIFALVGESGGGKTMLSLSVMQLLPNAAKISAESKILLRGQDLFDLAEVQMRKIRGKEIGMIFQEPMTSLNPVMSIGEQIGEVLRFHLGLRGHAKQERVVELLDSVGIADPKHCYEEYPHQLSGGMQQRAMIAMAIAAEPILLIADEATSALDVTIQAQILELLQSLQQKTNMSILLITHDLNVVKRVADKVAVIYAGEIVEQANAQEFFANPQHPYSKKLFAALPSLAKRGKSLTSNESNLEYKGKKFVADKSAPILLEVNDLKVYFPIRKGLFKRTVGWIKAVDGVSFQLAKGKTLALVGESGCGKTTTGKGLLQLIPLAAGTVLYQGKNMRDFHGTDLLNLRKAAQIVFQDPFSAMNPRMIVGDVIAEGMVTLGLVNNEAEKQVRIDKLLQQVNLPIASKYRYPHEFSGGQRQRICIARALAVAPELIICDEPTSALDVSVQAQILDLLKQLQTDLGLSYLFISHNLSVVAYLADEVAVMYQGRIVEMGPVMQVMTNPQHPYTKTLLQAAKGF